MFGCWLCQVYIIKLSLNIDMCMTIKSCSLRTRQNAAHINQYVGKGFSKLHPNGLYKSTFPQVGYGQGYSYLADSHA